MKDSELDQLLKDCGTCVRPPAGFQRNVWLRIETSEATGRLARMYRVLDRGLAFFTLPPVAVATCTAMVAVGAWFGLQQNGTPPSAEIAYIQSVSPFSETHR